MSGAGVKRRSEGGGSSGGGGDSPDVPWVEDAANHLGKMRKKDVLDKSAEESPRLQSNKDNWV